jgi:hypothetical protein
VQFTAVQEEVQELIRQGYGYKMIHEKLVNDGKITMSYDTFYNYLRRKRKPEPPKEEDREIHPSAPPRRLGVGNSDSIINHDKNPDRNDVI